MPKFCEASNTVQGGFMVEKRCEIVPGSLKNLQTWKEKFSKICVKELKEMSLCQ